MRIWVPILKTCFCPLIGASVFVQFTIKDKEITIFFTIFIFYAHAQQLKNEED